MTISLYIHWPFCESKCPYCDFNSHVREGIEFEKWQTAYLKEIDFYADKLVSARGEVEIDTIFFGGGTPSLMRTEMVAKILDKVKERFSVRDDIEITLEANPSSFEVEKFKEFKQAGINRVSIGVQSFDEASLKFLGRKHDRAQAINAIEQAGKIFGNFSFDLIYATPGQTLEKWDKELEMALQFGSPHISLYQLTIEKGTPFYSDFNNKKFVLPEEEIQTYLYLRTLEKCRENGLDRYEISNFARPGFESKHNMNYWLQNEYIGIGPGAHGRIYERSEVRGQGPGVSEGRKKIAYYDIHNPENWLVEIEKSGQAVQHREELTQKEILEELVFMGLRIREGISLGKFENIGLSFEKCFEPKLIKKLIDEGMMEVSERSVKLTDKGLLLHTNIVKKLIS